MEYDHSDDYLRHLIEKLRRPHTYVEDCWYSCPKAADGCCDDRQGDDCNCGADQHNARIDTLITHLFPVEGPES